MQRDRLEEIRLIKNIEIAKKAFKFYVKEFENAPNPNWHDVAFEALEILEGRKTLEDLKEQS